MCLIIDANVASQFSTPNVTEEATAVVNCINKKGLTIAVGGRNIQELSKTKLRSLIIEWIRRGDAKQYEFAPLAALEEKYKKSGVCKSDDPHIIALGDISGAKLLFSGDQALHGDFKNLCNGAVYQNSVAHKHLLRNPPPCK